MNRKLIALTALAVAAIIAAAAFTGATTAWGDANGSPARQSLGSSTLPSDCAWVGGGQGNIASGHCAVVAAGLENLASKDYSSVLGGRSNRAAGADSAVGGGRSNTAKGTAATIAGGRNNKTNGTAAAVGGGRDNSAAGDYASVAGGRGNEVTAQLGTIGGGGVLTIGVEQYAGNRVTDAGATVAGGSGNTAGNSDSDPANGRHATVGGGRGNVASLTESTVAGGVNNLAGAIGATVGGGAGNSATGLNSVVSGGAANAANGVGAFVGGGQNNRASAYVAGVGSGLGNAATDDRAFVGGGTDNRAGGSSSFVGAGQNNVVSAYAAGIGSGNGNAATNDRAFVAGGSVNTAGGNSSFVGAGENNSANAYTAGVVGGENNTATGNGAFIGAGRGNSATSYSSAVVAGEQNTAWDKGFVGSGMDNSATGWASSVTGGNGNQATGHTATVGGGERNTASGQWSTVPGGSGNVAGGFGSFAAGRNSVVAANHPGAMMFNSGAPVLTSADADEFAVVASGGLRLYSGASNVSSSAAGSTRLVETAGTVAMTWTYPAGRLAHAIGAFAPAGASPIEFDSASSATNTLPGTVLAIPHTVGSGDSRMLVVGTASEDTSTSDCDVTSVTFNGDTLTQAAQVYTVGDTVYTQCVELWYLAAPDEGTHDIVITWNGTVNNGTGGGISLFNVTQQAPEATATQGKQPTGGFISTEITTATDGAWLVDAVGDGSGLTSLPYAATEPGQTARYTVIGTVDPSAFTGCTLPSGSGDLQCNGFVALSDRGAKTNFATVDAISVLERLAGIPIESWSYRQDAAVTHIGPVAQDFRAAFGLGADDTHINTVDADGVAMAAIQGLYQLVREKDAQIVSLESRLSTVEAVAAPVSAAAHQAATTAQKGGIARFIWLAAGLTAVAAAAFGAWAIVRRRPAVAVAAVHGQAA